MACHSSATAQQDTPHVTQTRTNTIINALKQRAQAVLNDKLIDPESRAIIRYAFEINDPWLARLVRGAEDGADLVEVIETKAMEEDSEDELRRRASMATD